MPLLKVGPHGEVASFVSVSKKGLGHVCFKDDRLTESLPRRAIVREILLGPGS